MKIELEMSQNLEEQLKEIVLKAAREALNGSSSVTNGISKEWMNLKEGATYAGVSYNTLIKFREMGLKFTEIEGVKRVSKQAIDKFLKENSY